MWVCVNDCGLGNPAFRLSSEFLGFFSFALCSIHQWRNKGRGVSRAKFFMLMVIMMAEKGKNSRPPGRKKTLPMPLSSVWRILESTVLRAYSCILCAPDVCMYALCFIVTYSWIHFVSLWHINEFIVLHWDIFTNSFPFLWSVNSLSFTVQCFYPLCITKTY